jgi:hypothetical protein
MVFDVQGGGSLPPSGTDWNNAVFLRRPYVSRVPWHPHAVILNLIQDRPV